MIVGPLNSTNPMTISWDWLRGRGKAFFSMNLDLSPLVPELQSVRDRTYETEASSSDPRCILST